METIPIPGAEMGAANIGQARPGTVCRTDRSLLTCANVREEPLRSPAYLADKDTCGQLDGRGDARHRQRRGSGKIRRRLGMAGYPALRLMTLAETGTRGLLGAALRSRADRDETAGPAAAAPARSRHAGPAGPGLRQQRPRQRHRAGDRDLGQEPGERPKAPCSVRVTGQ